jgi:RNA polymerase sigma-70 factor (ECF subfamily)
MEIRKKQRRINKQGEIKENEIFLMDYSQVEHLEEKELHIHVMQIALKELNNEQRQCLELFYLQSKSYNEIEVLTGFTNKEVKSYIQNGKRNLKIKMDAKINEQARK